MSRLSIPARAHPLVRQLYALADAKGMTIAELSRRAGMGKQGPNDWRTRRMPRVDLLEACFNVLGHTLQPVQIDHGVSDGKPKDKTS